MKQLTRSEVLTRAANGLVTVKEAAEALGISERHTKRLKKKVKEEGAAARLEY
jgi:DNA invertase Pin-like site-specific DNA recombinase